MICILAISFIGCKSTKVATNQIPNDPDRMEKIAVPLSESKYQTDKQFFRTTQVGVSPDMSFAKTMAISRAQAQIAQLIDAKVRRFVEEYTSQTSVSDAKDFENKMSVYTRTTVSQLLKDTKIIGEEVYRDKKTGEIHYNIAIEISRVDLLNGIADKVSKDQKLNVEFNSEKLRAKAEQVWDKEDNSK